MTLPTGMIVLRISSNRAVDRARRRHGAFLRGPVHHHAAEQVGLGLQDLAAGINLQRRAQLRSGFAVERSGLDHLAERPPRPVPQGNLLDRARP